MSYILILYFMGTHVIYDMPSKAACDSNANLAADLLAKRAKVRVESFTYQCWSQVPVMIELATRMERGG